MAKDSSALRSTSIAMASIASYWAVSLPGQLSFVTSIAPISLAMGLPAWSRTSPQITVSVNGRQVDQFTATQEGEMLRASGV